MTNIYSNIIHLSLEGKLIKNILLMAENEELLNSKINKTLSKFDIKYKDINTCYLNDKTILYIDYPELLEYRN